MLTEKKKSITREKLKHNFLKEIIIRIDFSGVSDIELESIIPDIKKLLGNKGYNKFNVEFATEMDFQVEDPELIEIEGIPVKDIRRQQVYVFGNKVAGIQLKISSVFAFVIIRKTKYINFFEYSNTLIDVVKIIKEKIAFFDGIRFGLRKINNCLLTDIEKINDYFEKDFFNLFHIEENSETKIFNAKDCLAYEEYNINLTRTVLSGEIDGKPAYQVVLDSDIYLIDNEKIADIISSDEQMKIMNDMLFEIYKSVITEKLLDKLQKDIFEDDFILGVDSNE